MKCREIIDGDVTYELTERHVGAIAKRIEPGDLVYSPPACEAVYKDRRADAQAGDPLLEKLVQLCARRRLVLVADGPFYWRVHHAPLEKP